MLGFLICDFFPVAVIVKYLQHAACDPAQPRLCPGLYKQVPNAFFLNKWVALRGGAFGKGRKFVSMTGRCVCVCGGVICMGKDSSNNTHHMLLSGLKHILSYDILFKRVIVLKST